MFGIIARSAIFAGAAVGYTYSCAALLDWSDAKRSIISGILCFVAGGIFSRFILTGRFN